MVVVLSARPASLTAMQNLVNISELIEVLEILGRLLDLLNKLSTLLPSVGDELGEVDLEKRVQVLHSELIFISR